MADVEDDDDLVEEYEAIPERLMDGEALIFDPIEFAEEFDALAAMCRDGQLWVLQRKTKKWVTVEASKKAAASLQAVPTTKQ